MIVPPSLVALLAVLAALVVGGVAIHHQGYRAGQAEREAYYAPLMRAAELAKLQLDQRVRAADLAAKQITQDVETRHVQAEADLANRARRAESSIAELLRQHAPACTGREHLPTVPNSATRVTDAARESERAERLASSVRSVGQGCEADAERLARWQEWYQRQRAALSSVPTPHR